MVDSGQVQKLIATVLRKMNMYSPEAVQLVYRTGLVESNYKYIRQLGTGPARGFYQVEPGPSCCMDICKNYLKFRKKLLKTVSEICHLDERYFLEPKIDEWSEILESSITAGIVMCRLKYRRCPKPLPKKDDIIMQSRYWKKYYNSSLGSGTPEKFVQTVNHYSK
tara:strand:- start:1099 stop:1593 length:495 start_codon:yes stop_codon:yes gene_type:complete